MATTKNDDVTVRQGRRDHGIDARTAPRTTGVIDSVRTWARRCDDRLHRR